MRFRLRHVTTYRYARPVKLGRHRLMLRPRDSHEMKLHAATLTITPAPSQVVWQYDVFSNSVAMVEFATEAPELTIESSLDVERFPFAAIEYMLPDHARSLPLAYSADEIRDLAGLQERHVPDPDHAVDTWAKEFLASGRNGNGEAETIGVLNAISNAMHDAFCYVPRDAYGTQSPIDTLVRRSGTCRDYAYLMMETARSLGLAARFVSGYLYDAGRDAGGSGQVPNAAAGATHAWAQVYLPGAGWTHFDPTNDLVADAALIPVAVVREPGQASPVAGVFNGTTSDFLGMEVAVDVTSL